MATKDPKEMQRMAEFVAEATDMIHHLKAVLDQKFAETPEGKEAIYLKDIVDHYVNILENFLGRLVSGEPGKRGIDEVIRGIEHPESEVKPDEKLLKELKSLAKEMEKVKLPDLQEWQYHVSLKHDLEKLSPSPDIHKFINAFNNLLVNATKYPETDVAKAIKERSTKQIPKTIELENFEFAVSIWKFILSRIYRPDQEAKAKEIIGSQKFEGIGEKIAEKLGISVDEFKGHTAECFPKEQEDNNMTNLRAFTAKIAEQGKKNIFMRTLRQIGQEKYAEMLINQCGKKGAVRTDPKTVNAIANLITKIDTVTAREKAELAARDEISHMVSELLEKMKAAITKEKEKFAKVLNSRIKELKEKHAKKLAEVSKMMKELNQSVKDVLLTITAADNITKNIHQLEKAQHDYNIRTSDILLIIKARTMLAQRSIGDIDEAQLKAELDKIISRRPSPFAAEMINRIRDLIDRQARNEITADNFYKTLENIDAFIKQLLSQITTIRASQQKSADKVVDLAAKFEDMEYNLGTNLPLVNKSATEKVRTLRKMKIEGRYTHQLSPEEQETLRRAA
jgi:hypothetical protein